MTDPEGGAHAVRLLLDQLEATVRRAHELRRQLRAEELTKKRLTAALDPAISTLPAREADTMRKRLHGAIYAEPLIAARAARTRLAAIMEYLAANSGAVVKVAEVTTHLERQGFSGIPHSYASDTLKRFEGAGLVTKVRFGRYRVNELHPEILALHRRAIEAEGGLRPPPAPTRARDEAPRFRDDPAPAEPQHDDRLRREIAANWEKIRNHPMWREGEG